MSNPAFKKGGPSPNPSGRPPKSDAVREAEAFLSERSPMAAARLIELEDSADEKVALAACTTHLKIVVGEKMRNEVSTDPDGDMAKLIKTLGNMTSTELLALARGDK